MSFEVGSLVKARGREWLVLPGSDPDFILLRPLIGAEDETTGILTSLEEVSSAQFSWPDETDLGDFNSAQLLRSAIKIGIQNSAGPFRSFGSIAMEPRPYQLVPLLMALRQKVTRLLIADDVGIGKTIEAGLIVRELLDSATIKRFAVLCPPHLAEQWQKELFEKFDLSAEVVLASTVRKLERNLPRGESLFEHYPYVIISIDFVKSDRRKHDFLRSAPELIIVDEAHSCSFDLVKTSHHQRYELISTLSQDLNRHMVLLTATPHSGNVGAFNSLVSFLDPSFGLDMDLMDEKEARKILSQHLIQRRRSDIKQYLDEETVFPDRQEAEVSYRLHQDYERLFQKTFDYAKQTIGDIEDKTHHQRVKWWSILALLRALSSSPAAAEASLKTRSEITSTTDASQADLLGKRTILDLSDQESSEFSDCLPEFISGLEDDQNERLNKRLKELAKAAQSLKGPKDAKLQILKETVSKILNDGFSPIIFCRFIQTAHYVEEHLKDFLGPKIQVASVTGDLPPSSREEVINQLGKYDKRVLVSTDCLSEGINLQHLFDSVIHYDLAWNPTRHEQRDGRVDRFGQPKDTVRSVMIYGQDNRMDEMVLKVLIRKAKAIRSSLGIFVPIPGITDQLMEVILEEILNTKENIQQMSFDEELFGSKIKEVDLAWEKAAENEKKSRSRFSQSHIDPQEVANELEKTRQAIGSDTQIAKFVQQGVTAWGGKIDEMGIDSQTKAIEISLSSADPLLLQNLGGVKELTGRFSLPLRSKEVYFSRNNFFVKTLARQTLGSALDRISNSPAKRASVIRTKSVTKRTTLALLRFRFDILPIGTQVPLIAEEIDFVGYEGSLPNDLLEKQIIEQLLESTPDANVDIYQAKKFINKVIENKQILEEVFNQVGQEKAQELADSHERVRKTIQSEKVKVKSRTPDVVGLYVLLPVGA